MHTRLGIKYMKIFLDTAHAENIQSAMKTGLVDGVTTNPSHLAKESGEDIQSLLLKICAMAYPGDVSIEVTELEPEAVYKQAKKIAGIATNVVVKIPCHTNYLPIIKQLVEEGVSLNITLVFSLTQAMCMAKLGVKYVSPFVGRLEDIGENGIQLLADIRQAFDVYGYSTQILAASLRNLKHMHEAILCGADVATLPVKLFNELVEHSLTDEGMKLFTADWQKLGIKQFP